MTAFSVMRFMRFIVKAGRFFSATSLANGINFQEHVKT